jgi:hypothetical protein
MAYAYVQKGGGTFTQTVTWSQATAAGNTLVLCFVWPNQNGNEYVSSLAGNVNTSQSGWKSAVGTINTVGSRIATSSGNAAFSYCTLLYLPGSSNAGGDTTTTVTVSGYGGGNIFMGALEYSGLNSTSPFVNYSLNAQSDPGTGTNAITSNNVNVSTTPAALVGFCYSLLQAGGSITGGTGFTFRGGLDAADSPNYYILGEDQRITSSGNVAATFTDGTFGATDTTLGIGLAFAEMAPPNVADGTSSSSTTVATGTGGSAMPAIVVGQVLDVMLMAETSSALTDSGPSDGSNTYFNIRTFDDHVANGYIWDHWGCIVTVPLASPVISTTWSGGTPTKAAIAVGIIPGLIGTNPGVTLSGQAFQTAPSGSNAQVCAIGSSNPTNGIYYTLAGWGYSLNQAAAPAAGTSPIGFNQIGTVWAALGTGACMTFETQTIQGTGAAVEVTFTPVAGNTYTFSAAWQNILGTIIAWIT